MRQTADGRRAENGEKSPTAEKWKCRKVESLKVGLASRLRGSNNHKQSFAL